MALCLNLQTDYSYNDRKLNMNVIEAEIDGVKIIEPDVFGDERGWFCVTYHAERYCKAGIEDLDRI